MTLRHWFTGNAGQCSPGGGSQREAPPWLRFTDLTELPSNSMGRGMRCGPLETSQLEFAERNSKKEGTAQRELTALRRGLLWSVVRGQPVSFEKKLPGAGERSAVEQEVEPSERQGRLGGCVSRRASVHFLRILAYWFQQYIKGVRHHD